ncbi:putative glyoxalase superfamily protein PhnB [Rubellimicrobium aerolatum]|nr:putative glyoxalase superfamily protein PhnB [Rubellimicrobium aerolatum]
MTRHHLLPEQRVTLVTLGVRDLGRSRAFYRALGWQPAQETERISFYQMHGAALALFGLGDLADDQDRPVGELGTGAVTLAQNFGAEEDVDAAWHRAMQAGAKAIKVPQATSWGGYSGYFADPDGHVWELAVNPFWPLAEDGSLTLPTP